MALKHTRRPSPLRLLAGVLLLTEIATFYYANRIVLVNLLLGLGVIAGVAHAWQWNPNRDRRYVISLVLTLPFFLWWFLVLRESFTIYSLILNANLSVTLAAYAIALQILQLFMKHKSELPLIFPLIGVFALSFAGDTQIQMAHRTPFYLLYLIFAFLSAFYFMLHYQRHRSGTQPRQRMRYYTLLAIVLLSSIGLGYPTARFLEWAEDGMSTSILNRFTPSNIIAWQKNDTTSLNSMPKLHGAHADTILARVYADVPPTYMRGQVYDTYEDNSWKNTTLASPVNPIRVLPEGVPEIPIYENLFAMLPAADSNFSSIEVWPEQRLGTAVLAPHTTAWLSTRAEQIQRDPWGIAEVNQTVQGLPYHAYDTARVNTTPIPQADRALFTTLPDDLDPRVPELARAICAKAETPWEKAALISGYFMAEYDYELGITIPPGESPLSYFLFTEPRPAAHCEFFAAATAILLRCEGIPARYVTGVMLWEQAPFASYWIARNRDAHAWVEAWDPEDGWFIVESTPADGLPEETTATRKKPVREAFAALWFQLKRLWGLLTEGEWRLALQQIIANITALLGSAWGIGILLLLLVGGGWFFLRRRNKSNADTTEITSPRVKTLRRLLMEMDRRTDKQGYHREPHETPHAFANRLEGKEDTARWYRRWAQARFGAKEDEDVEDLENKMP